MRKTVKKAFLLNEAISNTAMGTSADEQMLCCRVFLSLISHSAVSCLRGGESTDVVPAECNTNAIIAGALSILAYSVPKLYYSGQMVGMTSAVA